jgi:hypothetical protein
MERLAHFPQTVERVQNHDYLMESGLRLTTSGDEIKIINARSIQPIKLWLS